jgi:hypothetical protein
MELLSVIRRWHFRDHFSIREISRRTGLSRVGDRVERGLRDRNADHAARWLSRGLLQTPLDKIELRIISTINVLLSLAHHCVVYCFDQIFLISNGAGDRPRPAG